MVDVEATCETRTGLSEVWELLVEPARIPEWNVAHAGFTSEVPQRLEPGGTYAERFKMMGMTVAMTWTVITVEPRELVVLSGAGPAGMTITTRYELRPTGEGTLITMKSRFSGGPADTAFAPAIRNSQTAADRAAAKLSDLLA